MCVSERESVFDVVVVFSWVFRVHKTQQNFDIEVLLVERITSSEEEKKKAEKTDLQT